MRHKQIGEDKRAERVRKSLEVKAAKRAAAKALRAQNSKVVTLHGVN